MKTKTTSFVLGVFLMTQLANVHAIAAKTPEWSYRGKTGPKYWATLCSEYSAAAGLNQSPINLVPQKMIKAELKDIEFNYKAVPVEVINTGHTIQLNYASGSYISPDEKQSLANRLIGAFAAHVEQEASPATPFILVIQPLTIVRVFVQVVAIHLEARQANSVLGIAQRKVNHAAQLQQFVGVIVQFQQGFKL